MAEPGGFCVQAVQGDSKHRVVLLAQVSLPSHLESDVGAMSHERFTQPLGQHLGGQASEVSLSKRCTD